MDNAVLLANAAFNNSELIEIHTLLTGLLPAPQTEVYAYTCIVLL